MEDDRPDPIGAPEQAPAPPAETPPLETVSLSGEIPPNDEAATPPAPPRAGGKKWMRIAAVAVLAVALLGAAAAFAVPAIIRTANPKAYIAASLARTLGDFSGDSAAILSDLAKGPFRVNFSLETGLTPAEPLNKKFDLEAVTPQMVWSAALECDLPSRRADLSLGLSLSGRHAASALIQVDDAAVSFGSPELTAGLFYCLNTETLGADMAASPVFGEESTMDPAYGFNFFDPAAKGSALDPATAALLKQFAEALNKEITVEKGGSPTVTALDREAICAEYIMTVPIGALRTYAGQSLRALYEDEAFSATPTDPEEFLSDLDDLLSAIQDAVTLRFYIAGNRVVLLNVEIPTDDDVWPTGQWTTEFGEGGGSMRSHFTTVKGGETQVNATFYYQDGGQFTYSLDLPNGDKLAAAGLFTTNRAAKTISLDIPELSVTADSASAVLGTHFSLEPMSDFTAPLPIDPTPLMELDQQSFFGLMLQVIFSVNSIFGGDIGLS